MSKPLIIGIVDDDDIYRFTILRTIKILGLSNNTVNFNDGKAALDFMIENVDEIEKLPDVIFLDVNMPVMDGFEFMREYVKLIPAIGKKITVFMMSSSVNPEDIDRAKSIPEITDYIVKPIVQGKLVTIISDMQQSGIL